ncbi:MAG: CPBP family intramembrane glutamic endopeptidase [Cyclobacteriaceae bacterium]
MEDFAYGFVAALVGIVYPAYAIISAKSTRQMLTEEPDKKVSVYKSTAVLQLILSGLIFLCIAIAGDNITIIGLSFLRDPQRLLLLLVVCWVGLWLLNKMEIPPHKTDRLISQFKDVLFILPANVREYQWATALSFIAGTLEEIIFRGFLYWQLHQYLPLVPAMIITNVVFASAHYVTKIKNVMLTFILGIFFSISYVLSGTLWIAICCHILVDLYSTTLAKKLFVKDSFNNP